MLTTKSGTVVPELALKPLHVVDCTNTLYGPSKTGKTVIVHHLLKLMRGHVDQGCVVSPSEPSNQSYKGTFPQPLIHYRMYLPVDPSKKTDPLHKGVDTPQKGALRFLQSIYQRQEMKAAVYKKANRITILSRLYGRLTHAERSRHDKHIKSLARKQRRVVDQLRRRYADEPGMCETKTREAKEKFAEALVLFYKKFLTPHVATLWGRKDLDKDERYSLTYLHFNPRYVAVFDDCASELKAISKNEIFSPFFYRNRHVFLTVIVCCQDDTDLPANLRKNSFVSIFTGPNVATAFFERRSNSFSKAIKDLVCKDISPEIFVGNRKFAYIREDDTRRHYYSFTAEYPRTRPFCSGPLLDLCATLAPTNTELDTDNPYYSCFALR